MTIRKLKSHELRWRCTREFIKFYRDPKKFAGAPGIVGQTRALKALTMGLSLDRSGYNVYVAGMAGTGRTTTIRRTLEELKPPCKIVPDRCYVYNFTDPSQPVLLTFPRGHGRAFRDDMKEFVRVLVADIPKALESPHVVRERELIVARYQRQEKKIFEEFAERLKQNGFALIQVQEGSFIAPTVFPVMGEEAVSLDHLDTLVKDGKLTSEERDLKVRRHRELSTELKDVLARARVLGKEMHHALEKLQERASSLVLDGLIDDLWARYSDEKVRKYLLRVKSHILKNLDDFVVKEKAEGMVLGAPRNEDPFWLYAVNLLHDAAQESVTPQGCPIIEEQNPTYTNLFGAIEYSVAPGGAWTTDFRSIKAGSLLKADGGFLIVNALDLLTRPLVWDHLKRILKTEQLVIQQPEFGFQLVPMALKPEPIALAVKVIVVGSSWLYHLLWNHDEDFPKVFKVLADFDTTMALEPRAAREFAAVLKSVCDRGKLHPLSPEGLAAMIEYGVEESGQRDRLSTRFTYVTDVLREADHWAGSAGRKTIAREDVQRAIDERRERHGLSEERVQRMIDEGTILIDTRGRRVGQVNGLVVYTLGHTSFGKPARLTATTSVGKAGIINIEREARLSGPIHDKGVLILAGFLRQKYAQKTPLTLSASLAFEQSYGGIEGDSASSTEIYALLSSLSGLAIDQGIAVTGSVNQLGDIQPIGGVNEKIEGFFTVCKVQGLTGKQGVIIPIQNVRHLMLREEVVTAVAKGKFHISAVRSIDEGIEMLTGRKAGAVHALVERRLRAISDAILKAGAVEGEVARTVTPGGAPPLEPPKPPREGRTR